MFLRLKQSRFFNHLLGSNLILLILIFLYDLLAYFVPLAKLAIIQIVLIFFIIDLILIGLKIISLHD
ncbi:hypothetical protein [uncultured Limosilactobacillus sp.]|uniref:Uncharacterized protein n=1 Tax=Limosilactobacillus caviae TaxID=1769424 RepID=A0ABQ2C212_9LACO|nr:hypothetical protein [uncultured Limosilactobacillus sp.]GGI62411.1 hypothetical protein GCM10011459_02450 [Limosilactobacillus caviae]